MSGDLIRLINRSKLVERSLFAIIDLLQGTKSLYGVLGDDFQKNFQHLEKTFSFLFISLSFLRYYCCSINLKRQSEHSGLCPDTRFALIRAVLFQLYVHLPENGVQSLDNEHKI